jgi:Ca-activated chloride channel family protein
MLAIDTSDSMAATDVTPTRIAAATRAARSFVEDLPAGFSVGLVTAGAGAGVVVAPTTDHGAVLSALGRLQLHPGTALGDAILAALAAADPGSTRQNATPGTVPAARIVLLSDGISTTGAPDETAISAAHDAKIPVSTIAFGTSSATVQSQGQTVGVPVDATALRRIAEGTDGQFFGGVTSTTELRSIYEKIGTDIRYVDQDRDLASWFAGLAFLLLFAAVAASMATTARAVPA